MLTTLEKYYNDGLLHKQTHPTLDLTIWNYSPKVQYERLWDDITLQCRGLVTNSKGEVIARPFKKFFNYEELNKDDIPNEEYDVYEKMDGSLGILFNYKGEWIMATRGSFSSHQALMGKYILDTKYGVKELFETHTYLFEIIYPQNRIVVDYGNDEKLVLLCAIETESGIENDISIYYDYGYDIVTTYKLSDGGFELLKDNIDNNEEGFVIRFKNGFRMKIKGDEYKRLHKLLTGISSRDIWEHLKDAKPFDDIIKDVPDEFYDWVKDTARDLTSRFESIDRECKEIYENLSKQNLTRKEFALQAKEYKHSNILFNLLDGNNPNQNIWKILYPDYSKPFKKDEN